MMTGVCAICKNLISKKSHLLVVERTFSEKQKCRSEKFSPDGRRQLSNWRCECRAISHKISSRRQTIDYSSTLSFPGFLFLRSISLRCSNGWCTHFIVTEHFYHFTFGQHSKATCIQVALSGRLRLFGRHQSFLPKSQVLTYHSISGTFPPFLSNQSLKLVPVPTLNAVPGGHFPRYQR